MDLLFFGVFYSLHFYVVCVLFILFIFFKINDLMFKFFLRIIID